MICYGCAHIHQITKKSVVRRLTSLETLRNFKALASNIKTIYLVETSPSLRETQKRLLCGNDAIMEETDMGIRSTSKCFDVPVVWCEDIRFVPKGKSSNPPRQSPPNSPTPRYGQHPLHLRPRILRRSPHPRLPIRCSRCNFRRPPNNSKPHRPRHPPQTSRIHHPAMARTRHLAHTRCTATPHSQRHQQQHHRHLTIDFISPTTPRIPTLPRRSLEPKLPRPPRNLPPLPGPETPRRQHNRNLPGSTNLRRRNRTPNSSRSHSLPFLSQRSPPPRSHTPPPLRRSPDNRLRPTRPYHPSKLPPRHPRPPPRITPFVPGPRRSFRRRGFHGPRGSSD